MSSWRSRRVVRLLLTALVSVSLVPLQELPVAALSANSAELKAGDPEKSQPLGEGEAAEVTPEIPQGDFNNPPKPEGLVESIPDGKSSFSEDSEIVSQTPSSDVYLNEDGTKTAEVYATEVNYQDPSGEWQKIDNTLVENAEGDLTNQAGPLEVEFADSTGDPGSLGIIEKDNKSVSFDLVGANKNSPAIAEENSTLYPEVFPGTDLQYQVLGSQIKEVLIVKNRESIKPSYRFDISTQGLTGSVRPSDNAIVFKDSSGNVVITVPQGSMTDSSFGSEPALVNVTLTNNGNAIDITPNANWLADPARVFPLYIDPTWDGPGWVGNEWADDYVSSASPNTVFNGSTQYGGGVYELRAGYTSYPGSQYYSYIYMNTAPMNGKQILDARLKLFPFTHSVTNPLKIYPVSQSFDANAMTWNTKANHRSDVISLIPTANQQTNIDVTSWMRNWTNGTWGSYGISMDTAGQNSYYRFGANENGMSSGYAPYFRITYNDLPPAATLNSPANDLELLTTTPTLSANPVTDPNGDQMKYWFRVSDTDNPEVGQIINSGWQTSTSWSIPTGSLEDGVNYSWHVITSDGNNLNAWQVSNKRTFKVNLHIGENGADPTDTHGPVSVNLVSGNATTKALSPSVSTVGGSLGVSYTYNSQVKNITGLTAKYYDGCNWNGSFAPNPYIVRTDPNIDFYWGSGSPGPSVQSNFFCGTWDGYISAPTAGDYCFDSGSDDGFRMWIGDILVIDKWTDGGGVTPGTDADNCIPLYQTTLPIHAQYYENQANAWVQLKITQSPQSVGMTNTPVPSSWFTSQPKALTSGWDLSINTDGGETSYIQASVNTSSVILKTTFGESEEFKVHSRDIRGVPYFRSPADSSTKLSAYRTWDNLIWYQANSADGFTYTFDNYGFLKSKTSTNDDLEPAATQYQYNTSEDLARLSAMVDPVSGKQVKLYYSRGLNGGGSGCAAPPPGFSNAGPVGALCKIEYPDGTFSHLYYSSADQNAQLMRIVDPGNVVTDFAYNTNGLLSKIADSSQMDYKANHSSAVGTYTAINYDTSNRATSVVLASPDGTNGTDALDSTSASTTNRPWHRYNYNSTFTPGVGGTTVVRVGGIDTWTGGTPSQTYNFNGLGQTTTLVDKTGITTTNVWDKSDRLMYVTNNATGQRSSYVYDIQRDVVTDEYGPAPTNCFSTSNVVGPDGESRSTSVPNGTCTNPKVPRNYKVYDENIEGLAVTWWNNPNFDGIPTAHSTKIRGGDNNGRIEEAWPPGGPYIFNNQQNANYSLEASGQWYQRFNGQYILNFWADGTDTLFVTIDNKTVITGGGANPTSVAINGTVGWHNISIRYSHGNYNGGQLKFMVRPPNDPGVSYVVLAEDLRPMYNLPTTEGSEDVTAGSPSSIVKTNYGTVGSAFDPAYSLAQSTSVDSTGLNLTTEAVYEAPRSANQYMRQTAKTLPADNDTVYGYYGKTETVLNPCTNTTSVSQAGLMKFRRGAAPESGTGTRLSDNYVYDIWGRVIAYWQNSDAPTCTSYDQRGSITQVNYPAFGGSSARTVTYNYAVGGNTNVVSVTDAAGTNTTTVDLLGRTTSYSDVWGRTTVTSYNLAGQITETSAPGDIRQFTYDSYGRLASQKAGDLPGNVVTLAVPSYTSANEISSVSYPTGAGNGGNGTTVSLGYDTLRRNNSTTAIGPGNTLITSNTVTYSQSGRVVDETIDGTDPYSSGRNFTYDGAGRLTNAKVPGHDLTYGFGATTGCAQNYAGKNTNRTSYTDNATTYTYCYNSQDRLLSTTDPAYSTIVYDTHGNTTTLGNQTMTYDVANRHMSTTHAGGTVSYIRDVTDRIVERSNGTTTTRYSFSGPGDSSSAVIDTNGNILDRTIGLVGGVSLNIRGNTNTWNYSNIHGDVVAQADQTGTKQGSTFNYDPFGQSLNGTPDNQSENLDNGWLGTHQRQTEHEGTLNIIEMGARQYVPGLGRFIEVDPVDGGSANDYEYVYGDPVNGLDLDGECGWFGNPFKKCKTKGTKAKEAIRKFKMSITIAAQGKRAVDATDNAIKCLNSKSANVNSCVYTMLGVLSATSPVYKTPAYAALLKTLGNAWGCASSTLKSTGKYLNDQNGTWYGVKTSCPFYVPKK